MKLIVGLGNPGSKYLFTRHNLGFMLIDALAEDGSFQKKHNSFIQKKQIKEQTAFLVKPQTFMNLSGRAVKEIMKFYKISLENLLVIHDDKDQAFGNMKFQKSRGHGGHNGIKNIHEELNTNDYTRLKLGVGPNQQTEKKDNSSLTDSSSEQNTKSQVFFSSYKKKKYSLQNYDTLFIHWKIPSFLKGLSHKDTVDYVLSPFNKEEKKKVPDFLNKALKAVHCFIQNGYEKSANQFNTNK